MMDGEWHGFVFFVKDLTMGQNVRSELLPFRKVHQALNGYRTL